MKIGIILIPMLFLILFFILIIILNFSFGREIKTYRKIFIKTISMYLIGSLTIIFMFAIIYSSIFLYDIKNIGMVCPDGIAKLDINERQEIFDRHLHFNNIDVLKYKENTLLLFFDFFYFSSMTFFTVGYGDITLRGVYRFCSIIEAGIGVAFTSVYTSVLVLKYATKNK